MANRHESDSTARVGALRSRVRRRLRAAPPVLLFVQAVHVVGDAAVAVALASTLFFDVPVGEARTDVGLYLLLAFAPYALLAPVVAPIVARRSESHGGMVVVSDVGRALLAVFLVSRLDTAWLYPLGFAVLVLSRAHAVSRASLVPTFVDEDDLLDANAAISFVSGVAGAVGGVVLLLLSRATSSSLVLLLGAGVFAAGTLSGLWLRPPGARRPEVDDKGWLAASDSLRLTIGVLGARVCLGFTAMLVAFAFHGARDRLALVLSGVALGVGTWLASLLAPWLRRFVSSEVGLALGALGGLVVVALATSATDGLPLATALAGGVGLAGGTTRLAFDAHVQDTWPPPARGPGYARYETLLQLGWVVGAAPGSLFGVALRPGALVVAALAGTALVGAATLPVVLRRGSGAEG